MMHVIIYMFNARNRLDQTLGKPGMWSGGGEKDKQKVTVMSGLSHIDNKVSDVEYSSGSFLGCYNTRLLPYIDVLVTGNTYGAQGGTGTEFARSTDEEAGPA